MTLPETGYHYGRMFLWGSVALFFLVCAGCTDLERSGYSAIPQNYPGSWEINPYGDLRN